MAAITDQAEQKTGIWEGLVSLKPLKKHFEWWVRLIAITVIPIVIICTVVIGMELTTPDLFKHGTGFIVAIIAENALNLGVEASMFGCIILAKDARKQGSTKMYAMMLNTGVFFALLTITTVAFKLFHASDTLNQCLLIFRDASVIGYVFLSHLQEDDEENTSLDPEQVATLEARLQEQVANITTTVIGASSRLMASVEQHVSTQVAKEITMLETRLTEVVAHNLENTIQGQASSVDYTQLVSMLAPLFDARISAIRTTIVEEIRSSSLPLDTATIESGQSVSRLRLSSGHQKTVKVDTSILDSEQVEASTVDSEDDNLELRIRALLIEDSTLSARAIASRVGCSPTTASKWKARIEAE